MTVFSIRPVRPEDADALAAIHVHARREAMPWLPVLHDAEDVRRWMADHVFLELALRVADAGGRAVGYTAMDAGVLDQLYVLPEWQGRGIGHALLEDAKRLNPHGLTLWVFVRNTRARTFYEARGFVAKEETDGRANEEKEPDVRYVWRP